MFKFPGGQGDEFEVDLGVNRLRYKGDWVGGFVKVPFCSAMNFRSTLEAEQAQIGRLLLPNGECLWAAPLTFRC